MSTSPSPSCLGAPLSTKLRSSLRTSGLISGCGLARTTSSRASFWSGVRSEAYLIACVRILRLQCYKLNIATDLWQKTSRLWCQSTGSFSDSPSFALYVFDKLNVRECACKNWIMWLNRYGCLRIRDRGVGVSTPRSDMDIIYQMWDGCTSTHSNGVCGYVQAYICIDR